MKVYIDGRHETSVDVQITDDVTCDDVIRICQPSSGTGGSREFCLVELCMGYERVLSGAERIAAILDEWRGHQDKVKFAVRARPPSRPETLPGQAKFDSIACVTEEISLQNLDKMSISELQEIARWQHHFLDTQQQKFMEEQHRLAELMLQKDKNEEKLINDKKLVQELSLQLTIKEARLKQLQDMKERYKAQSTIALVLATDVEKIKAKCQEKAKYLTGIKKRFGILIEELQEEKKEQELCSEGNNKMLADVERLTNDAKEIKRLTEEKKKELKQRLNIDDSNGNNMIQTSSSNTSSPPKNVGDEDISEGSYHNVRAKHKESVSSSAKKAEAKTSEDTTFQGGRNQHITDTSSPHLSPSKPSHGNIISHFAPRPYGSRLTIGSQTEPKARVSTMPIITLEQVSKQLKSLHSPGKGIESGEGFKSRPLENLVDENRLESDEMSSHPAGKDLSAASLSAIDQLDVWDKSTAVGSKSFSFVPRTDPVSTTGSGVNHKAEPVTGTSYMPVSARLKSDKVSTEVAPHGAKTATKSAGVLHRADDVTDSAVPSTASFDGDVTDSLSVPSNLPSAVKSLDTPHVSASASDACIGSVADVITTSVTSHQDDFGLMSHKTQEHDVTVASDVQQVPASPNGNPEMDGCLHLQHDDCLSQASDPLTVEFDGEQPVHRSPSASSSAHRPSSPQTTTDAASPTDVDATFSGQVRDLPSPSGTSRSSVSHPLRRRLSSGSGDVSSPDKPEKPVPAERTEASRKYKVKRDNRRVQFEPLAILLDAALEGELELVKNISQVCDINSCNNEGTTALHNAVCAGHFNIVQYLVDSGCDVDAADADGWTPLHCAASCNNLAIVKLLIQHGACVFATTLSDLQKPSEKCELEDGCEACLQYLQDIETMIHKPGTVVYGVFDYEAENPDELSFHAGDQLLVMHTDDASETEWLWCKLADSCGYVPQNLIALYPRAKLPNNAS